MSSSSSGFSLSGANNCDWQKLLSTPKVSHAALANVLSSLGVCSSRSAKRKLQQIKRSTDEFVVPLGLPGLDIRMVDVVQLMKKLAEQSGAFGQLLAKAALDHKGMKLQLIVYFDEITPGNVLAADHQRKSTLVYVAIKQFGCYLSLESSWLPIAVVRHHTMEAVAGGLNGFMAKMILELQKQFSRPFCIAGSAQAVMVQVDLNFLYLADEAALKGLLGAKGASGVKPCMKCKNVLYKAAAAQTHDDYFVLISEKNYRCFDVLSDSELDVLANSLMEAAASKPQKEFEELQKHLGYNWIPTGTLVNPVIRSTLQIQNFLYDSMHVYFSNGIFSAEMNLLFRSLKTKTGLTCASFQSLLRADWIQTGSVSATKFALVAAAREKLFRGEFYKGSASQLLTLIPFMCFFVVTVLESMDDVADEVASMVCILTSVAYMQRAKHGERIDVQRLLANQSKHMERFLKAYGLDAVRPKHHYQFHVSTQLATHGFLLDCFTPERKHRVFKQDVAPNLLKLEVFEKSALMSLLAKQLNLDMKELSHLSVGIGHYALDAQSAKEMGVSYVRVSKSYKLKRDILKVGHCRIFAPAKKAVIINAFVEVPQGCLCLCDCWDLARERLDFACSWWSLGKQNVFLSVEDVATQQHAPVYLRFACLFLMLKANLFVSRGQLQIDLLSLRRSRGNACISLTASSQNIRFCSM
jgi:hypothetical protein